MDRKMLGQTLKVLDNWVHATVSQRLDAETQLVNAWYDLQQYVAERAPSLER